MHIKIAKSEKPQTPRHHLTGETIAEAVAHYLATGGRVYVCPPAKRKR